MRPTRTSTHRAASFIQPMLEVDQIIIILKMLQKQLLMQLLFSFHFVQPIQLHVVVLQRTSTLVFYTES